jgi:hypothetical protein
MNPLAVALSGVAKGFREDGGAGIEPMDNARLFGIPPCNKDMIIKMKKKLLKCKFSV